jgi:hypothetical protein
MPTQEEIEEALLGIYNSSWSRDILAAAYLAKKARAELAERQYRELSGYCKSRKVESAGDGREWIESRDLRPLIARHEVERKALSSQPVDKTRNAEG